MRAFAETEETVFLGLVGMSDMAGGAVRTVVDDVVGEQGEDAVYTVSSWILQRGRWWLVFKIEDGA